MRWTRIPWFQIIILLLCAIGFKILLLSMEAFPFNSDEAVVGLMARHILEGEKPIFFYGQAYMGSLDAWLVALGFSVFGSQVWVIRAVQIILYSLTIIAVILTGKVGFGSWKQGILAGCFLAIPAVNTTLYTTASLGGYGEAMLIGSLGLLLGFWMLVDGQLRHPLWMAVWGILLGLGLWANGLSLVFFLPMGVALLARLVGLKSRGRIGVFAFGGLIGFFVGSAPWWVYAIQNGLVNLVGELSGRAVAVEQAGFLSQAAAHLVNLVVFGFPAAIGLRPPWEVRWLGLPLLPFILIFWGMVIIFLFRLGKQARGEKIPILMIHRSRSGDRSGQIPFAWPATARPAYAILSGKVLTLGLLFVLTPFGVDPSGRYFLPLAIPLALGAAGWVLSRKFKPWLKGLIVGMVLLFNLWGNLDCALRQPPGITTQFYETARVDHQTMGELIEFLTEKGETRGYTNYWVAYPLAFRSNETLIFTPSLPYHPDLSYTARDNRYPPYSEQVEKAGTTAYITTRNEPLDEKMRFEFKRLEITWEETWIGEYHVYYDFSRPVRPGDIGLGSADQDG